MKQTTNQQMDIDDSESITRILFSPSMVDNNCVSPTAFELNDLPNGPEKYVSLFLLNIFQPTPENCAAFRVRQENDTLYGYAVSKIEKCKDISNGGISVIFKRYERRIAGHIGLHYSKDGVFLKGSCANPSIIIITKLLARQFTAFPFLY